jgi:hypothetical protein
MQLLDEKMNQSEITNALEKGLGRIYLYIEKNGDESIREQLLHFCLKNYLITYNHQLLLKPSLKRVF